MLQSVVSKLKAGDVSFGFFLYSRSKLLILKSVYASHRFWPRRALWMMSLLYYCRILSDYQLSMMKEIAYSWCQAHPELVKALPSQVFVSRSIN